MDFVVALSCGFILAVDELYRMKQQWMTSSLEFSLHAVIQHSFGVMFLGLCLLCCNVFICKCSNCPCVMLLHGLPRTFNGITSGLCLGFIVPMVKVGRTESLITVQGCKRVYAGKQVQSCNFNCLGFGFLSRELVRFGEQGTLRCFQLEELWLQTIQNGSP